MLLKIVVGAITLALFCYLEVPKTVQSQRTLLVSIDALRYDFLFRPESKHLQELASMGLYGPMLAQFPSFTFTNHFSIITGKLPVNHGIVSNNFYDGDLAAEFRDSDYRVIHDKRWWLSKPFWMHAAENGFKTATVFWPSSDIFNHSNHIGLHYNKSMANEERVEQIFRWLDDGIDFATLYISTIDDYGHRYGPDSPKMSEALMIVDRVLRLLIDGLKERKLLDSINLILLSDHGLYQAAKDGPDVDLHFYLPEEVKQDIIWIDGNCVTFPHIKPGREEKVFEAIEEAIDIHSLPLTVSWTKDLTERLGVKESSRIGPITIMAHPGYTLVPPGRKYPNLLGIHGYDPELPEMTSTIIITGPLAKHKGELAKKVNNLDVYNLLCFIFGLTPEPNDGSEELITMIADPLLDKNIL